MTTFLVILPVVFFPHKTTTTFNCSPYDWILINFCWFLLHLVILSFPTFFSSASLFTFHLYNWFEVFNLYFLLPVSCIARTFLLYLQSSLWLVLTVLPAECFFTISSTAPIAVVFCITLFTYSDNWIDISVFAAAAACTHFSLYSESHSSSWKHKRSKSSLSVISYVDWQFLEVPPFGWVM